jgi:hypothetical protein
MPILTHKDRDRGPEDWQDVRAQSAITTSGAASVSGCMAAATKGDKRGRGLDGHPVGAHPKLHERGIQAYASNVRLGR